MTVAPGFAAKPARVLKGILIRKGDGLMAEAPRVAPEEVYPRVKSGQALLVCAYDRDEQFRQMRLEGAISLGRFQSLLPSLAKDREIVFYCA
jgi:hypothetical protein